MFRTLHYMKKRAVNPAHALALCYAGMVCLAMAVNLPPIFLTTVRVDLGGRAGLRDEQLGRISALTFAGLVGGILFTGPLADRWGGKLFSILGTLLIGVGLVLLGISPTYSMVLVAVFVMGLGAGILDMVLSPMVAALQPDSRAKAFNWLHSFYGIGTAITVLVGTFTFRLGIGWRTTSLTLITVALLVALGFVNVDLPPLISDKAGERTALRSLSQFFLCGRQCGDLSWRGSGVGAGTMAVLGSGPLWWKIRITVRIPNRLFIWRRLGARKPLFFSPQLYRSYTGIFDEQIANNFWVMRDKAKYKKGRLRRLEN
jgi:MFS family permease